MKKFNFFLHFFLSQNIILNYDFFFLYGILVFLVDFYIVNFWRLFATRIRFVKQIRIRNTDWLMVVWSECRDPEALHRDGQEPHHQHRGGASLQAVQGHTLISPPPLIWRVYIKTLISILYIYQSFPTYEYTVSRLWGCRGIYFYSRKKIFSVTYSVQDIPKKPSSSANGQREVMHEAIYIRLVSSKRSKDSSLKYDQLQINWNISF